MDRNFTTQAKYVGCCIAIALFGCMTVQARPSVERITIHERSDGDGYVIRFHMDGSVAAYSEPEYRGDEVRMILFNAGLSPSYARPEPEGPISGVREAVSAGHVVFTFALATAQLLEASAYRDRDSNDILLGLSFADGLMADAGSDLSAPVRRASLDGSMSGGTGSPTASSAPSVEGSRWLLDTVVIDAGHGGRDPGAQANGVREKDVTLAVALKLGRYLEERLGMNVIYTRKDDRFIELRDRGRIANENGSKLFISIHANAARNRTAEGAETYFLGLHKSDAARATMERENSVVKLEDSQHVYEAMTEEALIRMELTQSAYMRKSQELSELIQRQFEERAQRTNRGVKQAGFYVLWGASMPAVLVELGFITNPREAAYMRSEQGQDYLASAIYRAVREFKERYERGLASSVVD